MLLLYNFRIGWMVLIIIFAYFACFICIDQIIRYLKRPIVVSLDKDYRNWAYEPMAITICTEYIHKRAINELVERFQNPLDVINPNIHNEYHKFFSIIGLINAEKIHLIEEFNATNLFSNLTGEDLLDIVIEA